MDYCSCGTQANAQCTRCEAHLCASHAQSSRTPAGDAIDTFRAWSDGEPVPEGRDETVLCADCRADSVQEDLAELAELLAPQGHIRGTAWLLALHLWGEREAADDTYAAIVCATNGWDTHREVSPLDLALACLEEFGPELTPPPVRMVLRWHTPAQKTLMRVVESEVRAETLGQIEGWFIEYGDDSATYRLFLHARGEAYVPPKLIRIDARTFRYTIGGFSGPGDVASGRAGLVEWMAGVRRGDAEPAGELHCDRCTEVASAAIAEIALGRHPAAIV